MLALLVGAVALIASIISVMPLFRHFALHLWRAAMLRAGFPQRRYARWFAGAWGKYDNPYVDDIENLDLRNMYVPLFLTSADVMQETLTLGTLALDERDAGNLVICGAPGSGKSILLMAYGVGVLDVRAAWGRGPRVVPFLIQLRKLATFLTDGKGLAEYIVEEILAAQVGMPLNQAVEFLSYGLNGRRVVVMLDGLNEVTADHYEAVRAAIFEFKDYGAPDLPTYRARLVLTCRQQDFLRLRGDWIPVFGEHVLSLAHLRDSDILRYLDKVRRVFKHPDGPENFMDAVRASQALDLLRVPLILAMSVGWYSRREHVEIPSSITDLLKIMIQEMLDRHSFRRDPIGSERALKFRVADKERFLREFSLSAAERSGGFDDFSRADLVAFCESLGPQLSAVRGDPEGLVDEIIAYSGLLSAVSDASRYVYAHRIIQEYLVADELSRRIDGDDVLLDRATDLEWRQVVILYAALAHDGRRNYAANTAFIAALAQRSITLAGVCLGTTCVDTDVATAIVDQLARAVHAGGSPYGSLAALHSATRSPQLTVRTLAAEHLLRALDSFLAAGEAGIRITEVANASSLVRLLHRQLEVRTEYLIYVAQAALEFAPSDADLVAMLWHWLSVQGVERLPITRAVVARLLRLADNQQFRNTLDELQPTHRESAESNYHALIRWAERLDVAHQPGAPVDAFETW